MYPQEYLWYIHKSMLRKIYHSLAFLLTFVRFLYQRISNDIMRMFSEHFILINLFN